ncbi:hypothetical protein PIB30_022800 [Stylosanthes scabra]|uniref:Uncharacterized protein n=1 Tax=Stylosanthes scabra TaxID=79078 RepID=A0ABU6UB47_9FABA|nr:hypothetical protein [Stylosanthes scabra]
MSGMSAAPRKQVPTILRTGSDSVRIRHMAYAELACLTLQLDIIRCHPRQAYIIAHHISTKCHNITHRSRNCLHNILTTSQGRVMLPSHAGGTSTTHRPTATPLFSVAADAVLFPTIAALSGCGPASVPEATACSPIRPTTDLWYRRISASAPNRSSNTTVKWVSFP